jgi:hypothetical protein
MHDSPGLARVQAVDALCGPERTTTGRHRAHAGSSGFRPLVEGALLLFLWVGSGALRRVRGRSSQVKGACGVAAARALRAPLDLRASATPRAGTCGQAGGLPG